MRLNGSPLLLAISIGAGMYAVPAKAAPAPTFTITATNVTLPGGAMSATSKVTLASVNGYAGQIALDCQYSGGEMNAKAPTCGGGAAPFITLAANKSAQGALPVYPYGTVMHAGIPKHTPFHGPLAFAFLVFGASFLGVRRLQKYRLLMLAATAVLLAGITACGSNGLSGTFPYTVTATDITTRASVTTSISVTVP